MPDLAALKNDPPEFWVDVGGTFTDALCRHAHGNVTSAKVLSSGEVYFGVRKQDGKTCQVICEWKLPDNFFVGAKAIVGDRSYAITAFESKTGTLTFAENLPHQNLEKLVITTGHPAPALAIKVLQNLPLAETPQSGLLRLGTTIGTNALLERKGASILHLTTVGFEDLSLLGSGERDDLFAKTIITSKPLQGKTIGVKERVDASGQVVTAVDLKDLKGKLKAEQGQWQGISICLLHSLANPSHEQQVKQLCLELGFSHVLTSHEVSHFPKFLSRGDTTLLDSYLSPALHSYVAKLKEFLPAMTLQLMTSSGGLVAPEDFTGKDSVLSGPAGGVVGLAELSRQFGDHPTIGFDMGGTSTDVSRFGGELSYQYEWVLRDDASQIKTRITEPTLAIDTVAAGGGSLCHFDGVALQVGPDSAGANPGPASYGRGGPLAVTDLNVALGRIPAAAFPFPLDTKAVSQKLSALTQKIAAKTGVTYSETELAEGFLAVAVANMAAPIRKLTLAKGHDIRNHVIVSFGGAAAQHVCDLADNLGCRQILHHPHAAIFSAFGIGIAPVQQQQNLDLRLAFTAAQFGEAQAQSRAAIKDLQQKLLTAHRTSSPTAEFTTQIRYLVRVRGAEEPLPAQGESFDEVEQSFHEAFVNRFGFEPGQNRELLSAHVQVSLPPQKQNSEPSHGRGRSTASLQTFPPAAVLYQGKSLMAQQLPRHAVSQSQTLSGPALIRDDDTIFWLKPGWHARRLPDHTILAQRTEQTGPSTTASQQAYDPIQLALFRNQFASIAEQMGEVLRAAALSVNIRERLDFSCALFDQEGHLVVNAPHIPVHLGAMGMTVRAVKQRFPDLSAEEFCVINDPYQGGSHLPDVTVVAPVDCEGLRFYVASRAHHAEIGGRAPGSMPATATDLEEEGVILTGERLAHNDPRLKAKLVKLFQHGAYPSRDPQTNATDVLAQVIANKLGAKLLQQLAGEAGPATVQSYMQHMQQAAKTKVSDYIKAQFQDGESFQAQLPLETGGELAVTIAIDHLPTPKMQVKFGATPTDTGNRNATSGIVYATVFYVIRMLIGEDMPLNEGLLQGIAIEIPEDSLLNPVAKNGKRPAVAAGNVETSQQLVDLLLMAFGEMAASQGTMNNFLFGDEAKGTLKSYYETIGGGVGASAIGPGATGVQSHMTNTRLTDPEVLEGRFPVRLIRHQIRPDSGGNGKNPGGCGVIREYEFLKPVTATLITSRRRLAPPGLAGGQSGCCGKNIKISAVGVEEKLGSTFTGPIQPGERIVIHTPGGGGFGSFD